VKASSSRSARAEVARLQNSIKHLERSNEELQAFCKEADEEELDEETKREFDQSVKENEETMCVELLKDGSPSP
jgi:predicted transcriptional regulator